MQLIRRHGAEYAYKTVEGKLSSASVMMGLTKTSLPSRHSQLTNLKKYTRYSIIVQAYNALGAGPSAGEVMATTLEDGKKRLIDIGLKYFKKKLWSSYFKSLIFPIILKWQKLYSDDKLPLLIHEKNA